MRPTLALMRLRALCSRQVVAAAVVQVLQLVAPPAVPPALVLLAAAVVVAAADAELLVELPAERLPLKNSK